MSIVNSLIRSGSCIAIVLLSSVLYAQRNVPKYENVYKEAATSTPIQAYNLYLDYLSMNPASTRANLYFQLSELSSKLLREVDPVIQYDDFVKFAQENTSYSSLAMQYLTEVEVRRDRDLFTGVPISEKRISTQDVLSYLLKNRQADSSLMEGVERIHEGFVGMGRTYGQCADMFRAINERYVQLGELYSSWGKEVEADLSNMVSLFDSVRYFVDLYREALVRYPTKGYLVNYTYAKIEDFRISGFSPVNFTDSHAVLWDYGYWAEDILRYFNAKVNPLLIKSHQLDSLLSTRIAQLKARQNDEQYQPLDADQHLLLADLLKLNVNSVAEAELQRKVAEIDFLSTVAKLYKLSSDVGWSFADHANLFLDLHTQYGALEAATVELDRRQGLSRTKELPYKGRDELNLLALSYNQLLAVFKERSVLQENFFRQSTYLEYKKQSIPFFLGEGFYRATSAGFVTKCIESDRANGFYLSGSSINAQGFAVAFVAYSANGQLVNWLKTIDIEKMMYDDCAVSVALAPNGGCYALISSKSVSDPTLSIHTVVAYDAKGDENLRLTLPEKTLPLGRTICYDPLSNGLRLTFYGKTEGDFEPGGKLVVQQIGLDNTQIFRTDLQLVGSVLCMLPLEGSGRFLLIGNYNALQTPQGAYQLEAGVCGVFSLLMDASGKILKTTTYSLESSSYAFIAASTANGTITLIGGRGSIRGNASAPYATNDKPVYILMDSEGKLLYTNVPVIK